MILIQAAKLATAQRRVVRRFAQHKKGELNLGRLGKYKSINKVPAHLKEYAKDIEKISGEYSKNPSKKVVSWVKSYINNVKFANKWYNKLAELKTDPNSKWFDKLAEQKANSNVAPSTASAAPKPEKIIFDKNDI